METTLLFFDFLSSASTSLQWFQRFLGGEGEEDNELQFKWINFHLSFSQYLSPR